MIFPVKTMSGLRTDKLLMDGVMNALRTCCCFDFSSGLLSLNWLQTCCCIECVSVPFNTPTAHRYVPHTAISLLTHHCPRTLTEISSSSQCDHLQAKLCLIYS